MRSLVLGTAGHIDHGKSALVRALTGIDPDRLKEEQARGITIDLGFAHAVMDDVDVAFVDVPGHERFVRNMLAGAGGIDAVLLVVAADESVMPQTREHFDICRLLGIERGLIALTKADLVDAETRGLVALEVADLVAATALSAASVVPVSAKTGEGLDTLRQAIAALAGGEPRLSRDGVVRLPVDRVFSVKGFGTVVTGTLVSGEVGEGDELVVLPEERAVRVRGVQVHGRQAGRVAAPRRVAVNLGAIEVRDLSRGVTLASPATLSVTRRMDVRLSLLPHTAPLKHGTRVRLHQGTSDVLARISIAAVRARPADDWRPVRPGERAVVVPPGGEAFARLRLDAPVVVTRSDRVVLRACSPRVTIGGGVLLDPEPPTGGVRRADALSRFVRLDSEAPPAALWLEEAKGRGLGPEDLVRRGGLSPGRARHVADGLAAASAGFMAGARVVDARFADGLASRVRSALSAFHAQAPLEPGMPRETLRERAAPGVPAGVFDAVFASLAGAGAVTGSDRVRLTSFQPGLSAAEQHLAGALEDAARAAGLTALDAAGLAAAIRAPQAAVDPVLSWMLRERKLSRLDTLLVHPEALARLKADIRALAAGGHARLDVATFKTRYGLTRKHAIPLLEWLDRERVTRRSGDAREVLAVRPGGGERT